MGIYKDGFPVGLFVGRSVDGLPVVGRNVGGLLVDGRVVGLLVVGRSVDGLLVGRGVGNIARIIFETDKPESNAPFTVEG